MPADPGEEGPASPRQALPITYVTPVLDCGYHGGESRMVIYKRQLRGKTVHREFYANPKKAYAAGAGAAEGAAGGRVRPASAASGMKPRRVAPRARPASAAALPGTAAEEGVPRDPLAARQSVLVKRALFKHKLRQVRNTMMKIKEVDSAFPQPKLKSEYRAASPRREVNARDPLRSHHRCRSCDIKRQVLALARGESLEPPAATEAPGQHTASTAMTSALKHGPTSEVSSHWLHPTSLDVTSMGEEMSLPGGQRLAAGQVATPLQSTPALAPLSFDTATPATGALGCLSQASFLPQALGGGWAGGKDSVLRRPSMALQGTGAGEEFHVLCTSGQQKLKHPGLSNTAARYNTRSAEPGEGDAAALPSPKKGTRRAGAAIAASIGFAVKHKRAAQRRGMCHVPPSGAGSDIALTIDLSEDDSVACRASGCAASAEMPVCDERASTVWSAQGVEPQDTVDAMEDMASPSYQDGFGSPGATFTPTPGHEGPMTASPSPAPALGLESPPPHATGFRDKMRRDVSMASGAGAPPNAPQTTDTLARAAVSMGSAQQSTGSVRSPESGVARRLPASPLASMASPRHATTDEIAEGVDELLEMARDLRHTGASGAGAAVAVHEAGGDHPAHGGKRPGQGGGGKKLARGRALPMKKQQSPQVPVQRMVSPKQQKRDDEDEGKGTYKERFNEFMRRSSLSAERQAEAIADVFDDGLTVSERLDKYSRSVGKKIDIHLHGEAARRNATNPREPTRQRSPGWVSPRSRREEIHRQDLARQAELEEQVETRLALAVALKKEASQSKRVGQQRQWLVLTKLVLREALWEKAAERLVSNTRNMKLRSQALVILQTRLYPKLVRWAAQRRWARKVLSQFVRAYKFRNIRKHYRRATDQVLKFLRHQMDVGRVRTQISRMMRSVVGLQRAVRQFLLLVKARRGVLHKQLAKVEEKMVAYLTRYGAVQDLLWLKKEVRHAQVDKNMKPMPLDPASFDLPGFVNGLLKEFPPIEMHACPFTPRSCVSQPQEDGKQSPIAAKMSRRGRAAFMAEAARANESPGHSRPTSPKGMSARSHRWGSADKGDERTGSPKHGWGSGSAGRRKSLQTEQILIRQNKLIERLAAANVISLPDGMIATIGKELRLVVSPYAQSDVKAAVVHEVHKTRAEMHRAALQVWQKKRKELSQQQQKMADATALIQGKQSVDVTATVPRPRFKALLTRGQAIKLVVVCRLRSGLQVPLEYLPDRD